MSFNISNIGPYGNNVGAMTRQIKANSSNVIRGTNPAYHIVDFLAFFPQFAGQPVIIAGTVTQGSNVIMVSSVTGISSGMLAGDLSHNVPDGAYVLSVTEGDEGEDSTVTISENVTVTGEINFKFYTLLLPVPVILTYLNLANASVLQARYKASWRLCIGLFIAHFCTMFLQSMTAPGSPAAKVVAFGQTKGLVTSKSIGDVSMSIDYSSIAQDLDGWAAWKLTTFGVQFATMAKMAGMGGMVAP
jgi:hypothetical protein